MTGAISLPGAWGPPTPGYAWPSQTSPYSPWALSYLTPYTAYQEPPLPDLQQLIKWVPWKQSVPIFQKDFKSLDDLATGSYDIFQHVSQRAVFRLTKRMPEVLRDPELQQLKMPQYLV